MVRRLLVAVLMAVVAAGGGIAALADPPANEHGMCTAYFNGSDTGISHKREAGPFQAFEVYVGENDGVDNDGDHQTDEAGETATPHDVWDYCMDTEKGIGGTPTEPPENQP